MVGRRQRQPAPSVVMSVLLATFLLLYGAGCGGPHRPPGDGGADGADGDADGDADSDTEADADGDDVRDADPDWDDVPDADPYEADDADSDEGTPDGDYDPTDTTWLLDSAELPSLSELQRIEPHPDGGFVVAGAYGWVPWVARLDATGRAIWSRTHEYSHSLALESVGDDGRIYLRESWWVGALDREGRLIWERAVSARVHGLADGTVILINADAIARYSPLDGLLWSYRILPREVGAGALAISETGTIYLANSAGIVALDLDGALVWAREWSSRFPPSQVQAAAATEDGGLMLTGSHWGMWAARIDPDGELEWTLSIGTEVWGEIGEPCENRCEGEEGLGLVVSPTGESLVVGFSVSANEYVGTPPFSSMLAMWLDRDGALLRTVALGHGAQTSHGEATAAAFLPGGEWIVGGRFGDRRLAIASFDATGTVGRPCDRTAEVTFEPWTDADLGLRPLTVTLEPSTMEVGESDLEAFVDMPATLDRVCW